MIKLSTFMAKDVAIVNFRTYKVIKRVENYCRCTVQCQMRKTRPSNEP